jgi:hypothetical protein
MADIDNGLVDYNHFGDENLADIFTFSLTDPDGAGPTGQTFNITVNPVNDAPVVVTNNGLTLDEGATALIANTVLVASDADNALSEVLFTLTTPPANGEIQLNGVGLDSNGTFSMQDVDDGVVDYVHLDGQDTADSFGFSLTDLDGAGPVAQTFSIVVNPINDAPTVTLLTTSVQHAFAATIDISSSIGIGNLSFADVDAGANDVQLTITVDALATITVNDAETLAGRVTGNGTAIVQIVAPLVDISSELTQPSGIVANVSGLGAFNIAFDLNDLGNTGTGGALNDSAVLAVEVNSIDLGTLDGSNGITLQSATAGIKVGSAVTAIGDINADGFSDFAIAARDLNRNPVNQADVNGDGIDDGTLNGAVFVIYGNSSAISNGFDVDTLDGSNGFAVLGAEGTGDSSHVDTGLGETISAAGDFNGDGIADLLIGSGDSTGVGQSSGRTYVIFGEAGRASATINLSNENDSQWVAFEGIAGSQSGDNLASGDFNSDGFSDIAIGAQGENSNTGAVYLIFGSPQYGPGSGAAFEDLSGINNDLAVGIRFEGQTAGDEFGKALAMGNVYGDGGDALVIGSNMQGNGSSGGFYVVRNSVAYVDGTTANAIPLGSGTQITGNSSTDAFSLDVVEDMNGDGYPDIVFGTADIGSDGTENAGWIVPGFSVAPSGTLTITDASLNSIELIGDFEGDNTGARLSAAGDFNGDGFGDLIIGAASANADTGKAYIVFGSASLAGPTIELGNMNAATGISLLGVAAGDQAGSLPRGMAVSAAGDINGDGFDDLLIGAVDATHPGGVASGNGYLVNGSAISNNLPIVDAASSVGAAAPELVLGGLGAETLDGGAGDDILIAGPGDDVLLYDVEDLTRVDGGLGDDTLQVPDFGSSHSKNFAAFEAAAIYSLFENIELIELPDAGRNDLYEFDANAIRHMTDERNTLRITGAITSTAPRVQALDAWLPGPQVVEGPVTYNTFISAVSSVYLYVDVRIDSSNVFIVSLAQRASESTAGAQADQASNFAKVSGNGRYVVYQSTASNLDAAVSSTPGLQQIYRTDLISNETIMVSQSAGVGGDAPSYDPCISYDGSQVSFATTAQNLVGSLVEEQLLVQIINSSVDSAISLSVESSVTNECDFSSDGNFVAYYSDDEIYRHEIATAQTDLISTDMFSLDICTTLEQCGGIALSGDGSLAVFSTPVALSPAGDSNSGHDIILANINTGDRTLITVGKDDQSARPDISSDGNRIVFESAATNVTGFDSNGHPDIFIYDVDTSTFGRASTNDTGGATSVPTGITVAGNRDGAGDPAISGDGEFFAWLGNQAGFSLLDNKVTAYLKHVSGAINNSVLVGEAYRYHLNRFGDVFADVSNGVSIDFVGQHFAFHNAANNVVHGTANQIIDTNGVDDVFVANNPIYVENLTANSDGDALRNAT